MVSLPRGGGRNLGTRCEQVLDGVEDLPDSLLASAPGVGAEPSLLGQCGRAALQVRAFGGRVDQALQPDVLVRPQAPARAVLLVALEPVCQQAVTARVALQVAGGSDGGASPGSAHRFLLITGPRLALLGR